MISSSKKKERGTILKAKIYTILGVAVMAMVALAMIVTSSDTVAAESSQPSTPMNLRLAEEFGDGQEWVAVLQWEYDADADGFVVEHNHDGVTTCINARGYDHRSTTVRQNTLLGGIHLTPAHDHHFTVTPLREKENTGTYTTEWVDGEPIVTVAPIYPRIDELSCDENEMGYPFAYPRQYDVGSPAVLVAAIGMEPRFPPMSELDSPTGFSVNTADYKQVELVWDEHPNTDSATGFVLRRTYLGPREGGGEHEAVCLLWAANTTAFSSITDRTAVAYDETGGRNSYRYDLYAVNPNYKGIPSEIRVQHPNAGERPPYYWTIEPNGRRCEGPGSEPESTPYTIFVDLNATDHVNFEDGEYVLGDLQTPTGFVVASKYSYRSGGSARARLTWDYVADAPAYKVQWKKSSDDTWEEVVRSGSNYPAFHYSTSLDPEDQWKSPASFYNIKNLEATVNYDFRVATCSSEACDDEIGGWRTKSSIRMPARP